MEKKRFDSLSHIEKKKSSVLCVVFLRRVQSLESCSRKFNSLSHIQKKVQFFVSYEKKFNSWNNFFKKRFNSLSHFPKN